MNSVTDQCDYIPCDTFGSACKCYRELGCKWDGACTDIAVDEVASSVQSAGLVTAECGDEYCATLTDVCTCFNTPVNDSSDDSIKSCGYSNGSCEMKDSEYADIAAAHCCDLYADPCQCKYMRLPYSGFASAANTCGWDSGVCRLGGYTSENELAASACDATSCIAHDTEADCTGDVACSWDATRYSCRPAPAS